MPVIVNAILNEHQIIVDIVAFVNKGDFPRSRLGEKQRGKILAGWVTRKMRTLAQFAIRDVDAVALMNEMVGPGGEAMDTRASMVSVRSGGPAGSSLRNAEHASRIPEQEEHEPPMDRRLSFVPQPRANTMELPDQQLPVAQYSHDLPPEAVYHPTPSAPPEQLSLALQTGQGFEMPDFARFGAPSEHEHAHPGTGFVAELPSQEPPQIRLPSVDGHEDLSIWKGKKESGNDEEEWTTDAIMHMNLAGNTNPR